MSAKITELGSHKILSPIKAMIKRAKIVRINFFRTLEINQRFTAIQGAFIQEKNTEFCLKKKIACFIAFSHVLC